ncbi:MAG: SEL1-like repeat protein [Synergistaceae bacterium]|nr:SEL1-like repeat protein [Synergistaceae bacterium]
MGAFIEIVIEGVKKFGGEIVAGVLLAVALWIFPSLRKIFRMKDDSSAEVKEELGRLNDTIKKVLQRHDEALGQTAEEAELRVGIQRQLEEQRRQEALRQAEARKPEETRQREEAKRQLEAMQKSSQARNSDNRYTHQNMRIAAALMVIWGIFAVISFISKPTNSPPKDAIAQYNLGVKYHNAKNYAEAVKWYRKAAEQGYAMAQFNLGYMYDQGYGVRQDYVGAVKWYHKSAEQGLALAQNYLGGMYDRGKGVKQDYVEAVKWYRKAAKQGNAPAEYNLGTMYENGTVVVKNLQETRKWYQKAADHGDTFAKEALKRLTRQ